MLHRQASRVKRLTPKVDRPRLGRSEDVPLFAHERMTAQPGLNANLIALAGHQPHLYQRGTGVAFDHPVLTDRVFPSRIASMRLLLNQRALIPDEGISPRPGWRRRMSV